MRYTLLLFTLLGLLISSCQMDSPKSDKNSVNDTPTFDLTKFENIIRDKTDRFTQAHVTKDTAFLNSCFTSDARVFPPNAPKVSGIADIAQLNTEWVNYGIYEFKDSSTAFYGTNDYLIDEGTYYMTYGEARTVDSGKYINIWKNDSGVWKIYSNIWNSSTPLTPIE